MASVENGGAAAAAPKIRLVQCPRCKQILPELPNVPVYQCGGCGIHLQAKIRPRNGETKSPSSASVESTHLSRLESSGSSSVHQPAVQDSSASSSVYGETSVDLGNTKNSTLVRFPNADDDQLGDGVKLNGDVETVGSNCDEGEEVSEEAEFGDQQKDQLVEDGENSACSTDSTSVEKQEMSPDVRVDSEAEVSCEVPKVVVSMVEDHLEVRRSSSDSVNENIQEASPVAVIRGTASASASASTSGGEVLASPSPPPPPNEQFLNRLQERVRFDFDPSRYEEPDDFVSSELSGMLVDLTKSPTTRSCHAYYDGISDDQVPGRLRPYSRNTAYVHKPESNYMIIAEEKAENDRNNLGLQYQQKKYHSPDTNLDSEELRGLKNPVRSWGRLESDDELLSRPPLHPRTSYTSGYESGSTSYQSQNGLHSNLNSRPRVNAADIEQERIRLLRMVYELEAQLTRSCSMNDNASRKAFSGNVRRDEHVVPLNYDMDRRPYSRELTSWSQQQQRQPSRIPFSAEATMNGRHKVDHHHHHSSCCGPQEWKCSGQLPSHCSNHNRVFCRAHSGLSSCNSYGSCPSSPQRRVGSEYSSMDNGRATMSCEQRHGRDGRDLNRYIREKQHFTGANKRHVRPVAGGAPFLACHFCLKQLQLPADFLVSKRKFHTLRCGACSEILKFSLVNRTRLVPSSSEEDHASRSIANLSSGSFKRQNKAVIPDKLIQSNGKGPVETHRGTGPSNNKEKASVKTEEEIQGGRGGSPLHRLMGYSTLSGVLRKA
ncbi:Protein ENHANCED DISEASE RESISTANCE 4 [Linum grandiflorum]